ncbi:hypothetical protein ACLFMI_20810 [Pseudonocardia nantongensis]|uniref:hypothetical protein n=1 Tax=Pseudonocardia nantongensis TaxID=1181885 RepID=UPI003977F6CE
MPCAPPVAVARGLVTDGCLPGLAPSRVRSHDGRKRPTFVPHPPGVPVPQSLIALSRRWGPCPGFDPAELLRRRSELPGARGARGLDSVVALGQEFVRFDLAYPEAMLAIEYDGEEHDDALDRHRDLMTSALGRHTLRLLRRDLVVTPEATTP